MMKIVAPLRVQAKPSAPGGTDDFGVIEIAFGNNRYPAPEFLGKAVNASGQFP